MTIADKLTLLAASKEMVRLKLGIGEDVPFSEYSDHIGWDGITSDLGQSTTTAASQKLVTDREALLQTSITAILGVNKKLTNRINALEESNISSLFNNGASNGIWLDPSDLKTMFQDSKGTTPVTKDGDPVGLILDKSQGLILGEEKNLDLALNDPSKWTGLNAGYVEIENGINIIKPYANLAPRILDYKVGSIYKVVVEVSEVNIGVTLYANSKNIGFLNTVGTHTVYLKAESNTTLFSVVSAGTSMGGAKISKISIKEVKGNHASQPLAARRPTYRTDGVLHWLEFDGADDFLSANFNPTAISTLHFFSGIKGAGTGMKILYSTSLGESVPVFNKTLSGNTTGIGYVPNDGVYKTINHSKPVSQPFVNTDVFDYTANTFAYRDGLDAPIITSISNPKKFDRLLISSQLGKSFFMSGNLYGLIVGVNMNITNDALVMYLASKSGAEI